MEIAGGIPVVQTESATDMFSRCEGELIQEFAKVSRSGDAEGLVFVADADAVGKTGLPAALVSGDETKRGKALTQVASHAAKAATRAGYTMSALGLALSGKTELPSTLSVGTLHSDDAGRCRFAGGGVKAMEDVDMAALMNALGTGKKEGESPPTNRALVIIATAKHVS